MVEKLQMNFFRQICKSSRRQLSTECNQKVVSQSETKCVNCEKWKTIRTFGEIGGIVTLCGIIYSPIFLTAYKQ